MRIDNILKRFSPRTLRGLTIVVATLGVLVQVVPALAQLENELGISTPTFGKQFMRYAMGGLGVFLLFLIILIIKRRIGGGEKFEPVLGMTISDVGELKQKGLLTEEESRAVRAAVARQLSKQLDARKSPAARGGADSLLADPEIRRLEALAQEKAAAAKMETRDSRFRNLESTATPTSTPAITQDDYVHPLDAELPFTPAEDVLDEISSRPLHNSGSEVATPQSVPPASSTASAASIESVATEDDVQLPQDVLTMAQLGLITPEELENIKARARAKKREFGS